jgi:hypothetical protein
MACPSLPDVRGEAPVGPAPRPAKLATAEVSGATRRPRKHVAGRRESIVVLGDYKGTIEQGFALCSLREEQEGLAKSARSQSMMARGIVHLAEAVPVFRPIRAELNSVSEKRRGLPMFEPGHKRKLDLPRSLFNGQRS